MIDIEPHRKAIKTMDDLLNAWIAGGGADKGAKAAVEQFVTTDEYYAIPYQHRNLYFVTASKLRTYEVLPEQAHKQYIECIDLPWLDKDYFRIGRAFDFRITEGEDKFANTYVPVSKRVDVDTEINEAKRRIEEAQQDVKKDGTRSATGIKTEQNCIAKLEDLLKIKGKHQLTESQWAIVKNMTEEYRKQTVFPQNPKKLTLFWLAFGKVPCKAELDHWDENECRIWDIKTTSSITQFDPRQYLLQMGFYFAGVQEELMLRPEAALAVVDKGTDFSRGCPFGFKVEDLIAVQERINRLIIQWKDSMETGMWPSAGENSREALRVYWDSDYYPLLEHSRPTQIIYV